MNQEKEKDKMSGQNDGMEAYNRVAEIVGMVPSLRWKEHHIQAVVILLFAVVGGIIGLIFEDRIGAILGALSGVIFGTFISGFVLMILGLVRVSR